MEQIFTLNDLQYQLKLTNNSNYDLQLKFQSSHISTAKYAGPTAYLNNNEKIIYFYSNNGTLINQIELSLQKIVLFDFIKDELLLIIQNNLQYYLIDPYKNAINPFFQLNFPKEIDQILQAQIMENGVVIQAKNNKFFYSQSLINIKLIPFQIIPIEIQIAHWQINQEDRVIQIVDSENQIITLSQNEYKINQNCQGSVKKISQNGKNFAYLTVQMDQWYIQLTGKYQNKAKIENFDIKNDLEEHLNNSKIYWLNDNSLILHIKKTLFLINGQQVQKIKIQNKNVNLSFHIVQEIDGIRIISQHFNQFFTEIPDFYQNIFTNSESPANQLYEEYKCIQNGEPILKESIKNDKHLLSQAVQDCVFSSGFEQEEEQAIELLNVAQYGKKYAQGGSLGDLIRETCKILRVIKIFKQEIQRFFTYQQIKELSQEQIVKILLRYHYHYLANYISNYMNFDQKYICFIQIHWCCCKVLQKNIPEDQIYEDIMQKIAKNDKNVPLLEIIQTAIDVQKPNLAFKLIQKEQNVKEKINFLVFLANNYEQQQQLYYQTSLDLGLQYKDSDILYIIIDDIWKNKKIISKQLKFQYFYQNPFLNSHFLNYLKIHQKDSQLEYLLFVEDIENAGFVQLEKAYFCQNFQQKLDLISKTNSILNQEAFQDKFVANLVKDQVNQYQNYLENCKNKQFFGQNIFDLTINQQLKVFIQAGDQKTAQKIQKEMFISEKRMQIIQINASLDKNTPFEVEQLIETINKKKIQIPYELIAGKLIALGFIENSINLLCKVPVVEQMVMFLINIGQPKVAIKQAILSKNASVLLMDIKKQILDQKLIEVIDNYLASIK